MGKYLWYCSELEICLLWCIKYKLKDIGSYVKIIKVDIEIQKTLKMLVKFKLCCHSTFGTFSQRRKNIKEMSATKEMTTRPSLVFLPRIWAQLIIGICVPLITEIPIFGCLHSLWNSTFIFDFEWKKSQTLLSNMQNEPVLFAEHAFLASINKLACDCLICLWHFHQQKGESCEMVNASPLKIYRKHSKISAALRKPLSGECCSWASEFCQAAAACTILRFQIDFH